MLAVAEGRVTDAIFNYCCRGATRPGLSEREMTGRVEPNEAGANVEGTMRRALGGGWLVWTS